MSLIFSALVAAIMPTLLLCWGWYEVGRRHERKKMREENGWWSGFRAGLEQQRRTIQADLLEHGIVLNFNDPPQTKRN